VWDRGTLERELGELGVREFEQTFNPEPVGFVLHTNFGLLKPVVEAKRLSFELASTTRHLYKTHGFTVDRDKGPQISRFRIQTSAFEPGSAELEKTIRGVLGFAKQLKDGCAKAREQRIVIRNNAGVTVGGRPRPFEIRNITYGPIARLPFSNKVKADPKDGDAFGPDCSVWAQPVATVTVPLEGVRELVRRIQATEGQRAGVALTGPPGARTGRRSDALVFAADRVDKARQQLLAEKRVLSDRTRVDATTFSERLRGFLILIASYLWTSMLSYDFTLPSPANPRDFETVPEAYLPIAVHAPFSEIFRSLKPAEQRIFRELFAVGNARIRLFRLALANATIQDGFNKLLPSGPGGAVHRELQNYFATAAPTWDDFIDHTLDSRHKNWGDRQLVPMYSTQRSYHFSNTTPWVALELHRIPTVDATNWGLMMRTIAQLRKKVHQDLRDI
jgi:hypothetical protein